MFPIAGLSFLLVSQRRNLSSLEAWLCGLEVLVETLHILLSDITV